MVLARTLCLYSLALSTYLQNVVFSGMRMTPTNEITHWSHTDTVRDRQRSPAYSLGRIWLISYDLSVNEQHFSLTPNQPTVLSAMAYKSNKPKQKWRSLSSHVIVRPRILLLIAVDPRLHTFRRRLSYLTIRSSFHENTNKASWHK